MPRNMPRLKRKATTTAANPPKDTLLRQRLADMMNADDRSMSQISRDSGIPQSTLCAINTGARADLRADVVARLGKALGLTARGLGELLFECCTSTKKPT